MIDAAYFDGLRNINPGHRHESDPTLAELLMVLVNGQTLLYVDGGADVSEIFVRNGSKSAPYATIQPAVDYVKAQDPASSNTNRYAIMIAPGVYVENVEITCDGLVLMAMASHSVWIRPESGAAVTITNASLESLATYNTSGDYADLEYVPDSPVPADVSLINIVCDQVDTTPALRLLGVKGDHSSTETMFGWDNTNYVAIGLYNVLCQGTNTTLYARNTGMIDAKHLVCGGTVEVYNSWYHHVMFFDYDAFTVEQDDSSAYGKHAMGHLELRYAYGLNTNVTGNGSVIVRFENHQVNTALNMNGTSELDGRALRVGSDLDADDTATVAIESGFIGRDVLAEGGASVSIQDVHVERHINLASGAGTFSMSGRSFGGNLTDPDDKAQFTNIILSTPLHGICKLLKNDTGSNSVKGQIVRASSSDMSFDTCGASDTDPIGVVYDDNRPNGSWCRIVYSGIAEVLLKDGTASTAGYWVKTSDVAGRADATTVSPPGADPSHFQEVGHCVETKSSDTNVRAKVDLHYN